MSTNGNQWQSVAIHAAQWMGEHIPDPLSAMSFLLFQPRFFDLPPWNPITLRTEPVRIAWDAALPLSSVKFMRRLQRVYAVRAGATTPHTIPSCMSASTRGPTVLLVAEDLLCFSMFHVQQENNPLYCQCGGSYDFHRIDELVISSPANILAGTIPTFSSPPPPPVPVSAPIATPVMMAPSFFHPPPAGTGFQSISAPAPLLYPLVLSSSGSSALHTPLQTNPASMVTQMVASSSSTASSSMSGLQIPPDPLLTAGLQPPPSFPAYTGPSGPLVNVNGRNRTNARHQQSYRSCAFVDNLTTRHNSNQPSYAELCFLIMPLHCPNSQCLHDNPPHLHPNDPSTADWKLEYSHVQPLIDHLTALKLSFTMSTSKDTDSFRDVHKAVLDHQKRQNTPTIPGLNLSKDAQPHDCGTTKLINLRMHCSLAKAVRPAGTEVETRLKSCFVIVPSYGNIVHQTTDCFQADFKPTPIHPEKAAMPHPCFAARALFNLAFISRTLGDFGTGFVVYLCIDAHSSRSTPREHPPFVPTHHLCTPPPYENPKWDFPGGELQRLRQDTFSPHTHIRIRVADPKQAAQVLWTVLLHIGSLVHLLPDGEKVDPQTHTLPDLPAGATISDNWGNPAAFIQMTVSIDGPSIGNSITIATLSTLLQCLLDETDPDSCYGGDVLGNGK
ncbi:hypothetical protein ARMSODRAFT_980967 [Armillaria solidipes]|uniref:Uncharacterized protein n=1 Tax=Armillaria solidipes TaxID=1076256 RepID=A0A2H3B585_9AGAR|nr:hypothetical protein ARMSODRAFT_980967 [Armillaria solidipes]